MRRFPYYLDLSADVEFLVAADVLTQTAEAILPLAVDEPYERVNSRIECRADHERHLAALIAAGTVVPRQHLIDANALARQDFSDVHGRRAESRTNAPVMVEQDGFAPLLVGVMGACGHTALYNRGLSNTMN